MELNKRIKLARYKLGLKQEDLAKRLGVTKQSITNWERGASKPRNIPALAEALEVTPEWILSMEETK